MLSRFRARPGRVINLSRITSGFAASLFAVAGVLLATPAQAITHTLGLSYVGKSFFSIDNAPNSPGGFLVMDFEVGDSLIIDAHQDSPVDLWGVFPFSLPISLQFPLTLFTNSVATRTATIETKWLRDGVVQKSALETGVVQEFGHIGAQDWLFGAGTSVIFDQVLINWTLTDIVGFFGDPDPFTQVALNTSLPSSAIRTQSIFSSFIGLDFFDDEEPQSVPIPAGLPMLAAALGALAIVRRRRS